MIGQNGRAFNEWLRTQLKVKKMSQRQLAQQSGVDHSTISRLIRGDRMPSLGTATKLARGLREIHDDAEPPQYLELVSSGTTNPTARVEYSLRSDDLLTETEVRQVMEFYLAIRARRLGRGAASGEGRSDGSDGPTPIRPSVWSSASTGGNRLGLSTAHARPSSRPAPRSAGRPPGRY